MDDFSHLNKKNEAHMVDIEDKPETERQAEAQAVVRCAQATIDLILSGGVSKGDVFSCARIAGIMGAKKTADLIPLCHPLPLSAISVDLSIRGQFVHILARVSCTYKTGVEMEALTAASLAALTVYDMCKSVDNDMVISDVMLLSKSGGESGEYVRR